MLIVYDVHCDILWMRQVGVMCLVVGTLQASSYTGQIKVALVDVETHDNPIPLESYTMRQGKVWAVICHPGKPCIIIIDLQGVIIDRPTPATQIRLVNSIRR